MEKTALRSGIRQQTQRCEAEAAETQTWIQFAVDCEYLDWDTAADLYKEYDEIISMLVHMIHHSSQWTLRK